MKTVLILINLPFLLTIFLGGMIVPEKTYYKIKNGMDNIKSLNDLIFFKILAMSYSMSIYSIIIIQIFK